MRAKPQGCPQGLGAQRPTSRARVRESEPGLAREGQLVNGLNALDIEGDLQIQRLPFVRPVRRNVRFLPRVRVRVSPQSARTGMRGAGAPAPAPAPAPPCAALSASVCCVGIDEREAARRVTHPRAREARARKESRVSTKWFAPPTVMPALTSCSADMIPCGAQARAAHEDARTGRPECAFANR